MSLRKFSGTEVRLADKDYLILREEEIVGIFTQTGKAAGRK
jgi:co-chaperonin GroES (HSP10)